MNFTKSGLAESYRGCLPTIKSRKESYRAEGRIEADLRDYREVWKLKTLIS